MDWSGSMHPISWFRKTYLDGYLEIKPPFQRKPVWAGRQKCRLIQTILMNLPVPEVFIQQTTSADGETTFAIVDGQQRIRTVLQFIGADKDPEEQESNKFALDLLPPNSPWKGKTFAELSDQQKKVFYGYNFIVRYLNTDSDDDVRDMFRRLNQFLTPLKPQELRNAVFTGPFAQLAFNLADTGYWAENGIVQPASIRRMSDVEFVSELLIGVMHGPQGGNSTTIDSYYTQYEDYEDAFPEQARTRKLFEETLASIQVLFPEIKDTRWSNRSDFYSLFVAIASLLSSGTLPTEEVPNLKKSLLGFADQVQKRIADETAEVNRQVIEYVRAVEKGANDKKRRADRQAALITVIGPFFKSRIPKGSG